MKCINEKCNKNSEQEQGHWFNDPITGKEYWTCEQCEIEYQEWQIQAKAELQARQEFDNEALAYGIDEALYN